MARPAKAVGTLSGTVTKEEAEIRKRMESQLKGGADKLKPPTYLSRKQKGIFKNIVEELREADILGNLDVYILSQTAIAIDRIQNMEEMINDSKELLTDSAFMSSKDKYTKEFFRCCNELSLSPQSRAKISIAAVKGKEKKNPLLSLLDEEDFERDVIEDDE